MTNEELKEMYKETSLVVTIKVARIRWLGHVHRMNEDRGHKKALYIDTPEVTEGEIDHCENWVQLAGGQPWIGISGVPR